MRRYLVLIAALLASATAASAAVAVGASSNDRSEIPLNQRSAFADGAIAEAEYAAAVNRTVSCVRDQGVEATDPAPGPDSSLRFTMTFPDVSQSAIYDDCYAKNLAETEISWLNANAPDGAELKSRRQQLGQCLRATDPSFPSDPSGVEVARALSSGNALPECVRLAGDLGSW